MNLNPATEWIRVIAYLLSCPFTLYLPLNVTVNSYWKNKQALLLEVIFFSSDQEIPVSVLLQIDYAYLLFHLIPFGGFIQQLIEEQWNTINLIKCTNFTSLSESTTRYLERSRQHFHSSSLLTDPVFLLLSELSANIFSALLPSIHILGPETDRSFQSVFCSLSLFPPLLEGSHALMQRKRTLSCAGQGVLSCLEAQNLYTVVLPWAQLSTWR